MSLKLTVLAFFMLLLLLPSWTSAALTKEDLREIESLLSKLEVRIKEYVDTKIDALQTGLKADMKTTRAEVRAEIKEVRAEVRAEIKEVRAEIEKVRTDIKAVQSDVNALKWWLSSLTAFILVLIALPQVLSYLRERKEAKALSERQEKEISELKDRLARLEEQLAARS